MLPGPVYRRLWLNEWTTGAGDALSKDDIDRSLSLTGPSGREQGIRYAAGLDMGLSHDSAVLCVIGKQGTRYKVVRVQEWRPPRGGKVDIDAVERAVVEAHKAYHCSIAADPWQCSQLVQRCRKAGVSIVERAQTGQALVAQATALVEAFTSASIALWPHDSLVRDLCGLRVEERSYGFRLLSTRGPDGHGDRATALSIALAVARDLPTAGFRVLMVGGSKDRDLDDRKDIIEDMHPMYRPLSAFCKQQITGGPKPIGRNRAVVVDTSRPGNRKTDP